MRNLDVLHLNAHQENFTFKELNKQMNCNVKLDKV